MRFSNMAKNNQKKLEKNEKKDEKLSSASHIVQYPTQMLTICVAHGTRCDADSSPQAQG